MCELWSAIADALSLPDLKYGVSRAKIDEEVGFLGIIFDEKIMSVEFIGD